MDLLAAYMLREHDRGHVDEWVLFDCPYTYLDKDIADHTAAGRDWIKVIKEPTLVLGSGDARNPCGWNLSLFYKYLKDTECVYVRMDDDIVYIHDDAIPRLVRFRLANPEPFAIFPLIINNVRTSYLLQQAGILPESEFGRFTNTMTDKLALETAIHPYRLHRKVLDSLYCGHALEDFALNSRIFTDFEDGHISINSFAIFGRDMAQYGEECEDTHDEESFFSLWQPEKLGRQNALCGDSIVVHFSYASQCAYMEQSGMFLEYARLVEPWLFINRTFQVAPDTWPPPAKFDPPSRERRPGDRDPNPPHLANLSRQ
jgi:hypothetical protein